MNLDLPWLYSHIGSLTIEVSALRGEVISLRNELQNKDLIIADLKDQAERRLSPEEDDQT